MWQNQCGDEDAIEAGAHLGAAVSCRRRAAGLQIGHQMSPRTRCCALRCSSVKVSSLCTNRSAWIQHSACPANVKLTGIIADDDGVAQEAVGMNAAP